MILFSASKELASGGTSSQYILEARPRPPKKFLDIIHSGIEGDVPCGKVNPEDLARISRTVFHRFSIHSSVSKSTRYYTPCIPFSQIASTVSVKGPLSQNAFSSRSITIIRERLFVYGLIAHARTCPGLRRLSISSTTILAVNAQPGVPAGHPLFATPSPTL